MQMKWINWIYLLMALLIADGCERKVSPASPQTFLVNGVIRTIDAADQKATIEHEEIPRYMPAMTMPFTVKNTNELAGLQPGDPVVFRLTVTANESWIDKLKKVQVAAPLEPPQREPVRLVRDVEELKIGDYLPDYHFTNELGQVTSFSEFKGQALALTFMFTRCPLPDFCPRMSKNFSEVYKTLTAAKAPTNWHLLSISFDPHYDTPAVLKAYAQRYDYDPAKWNFVTGTMIDIDAITDQFNLPIVVRDGQWDHKLRTAVIDTQGRIQRIFIGNQWTPEELVAEIKKSAETKTQPRESGG